MNADGVSPMRAAASISAALDAADIGEQIYALAAEIYPICRSIAGPGVPTIEISGGEGSSTPFWRLVEAAGWFEAAWGPSPLPQKPPQGELGPRYTIAWTVPSSSTLHQDVYPYAKPFPVTSMPRGQKIFAAGQPSIEP